MPYPGMPPELTDKMDSCVMKVMKDGKKKDQAIAICRSQIEGSDEFKALPTSEQASVRSMLDKLQKDAKKKGNSDMPNTAFNGKTMRSLVHLAADNAGNLPTEIEVLPIGDWNTEFYGPMQVTEDICNQMIANFKAGIRKAIPVDVDHDGGKAAGWINELTMKQGGLYASVEWTPYGEELLKSKEYKLFSPEWSFNYIDPAYGSRHGAVLIAGSLTNRPLFKELPFLVASDGSGKQTKDLTNSDTIMILLGEEKHMPTIADILSKPAADRTADDLKELESHKAELTEEQNKQLADEKAAAEKKAADEKAASEKAAAEKAAAEAEAKTAAEKEDVEACTAALVKSGMKDEEAKTAAETMVSDVKKAKENITIKASELEALKADAEAGRKAKEELRHVATAKEVDDKFIRASDGMRIAPALKDKVVDFVMKCSEGQKTALYEILASLPPQKITVKAGDESHGSGLTAKEQIDNLVTEAMKANDKLKKSDAIAKVISEHPDLKEQADNEARGAQKE